MDTTVPLILLLTGVCISATDIYYFVREEMEWREARDYCQSEHTELAQIFNSENLTTLIGTPTREFTGKAWIGLYENATKWYWMDKEVALYSNWKEGMPDNAHGGEFCVIMDSLGFWDDVNCSEPRSFVCVQEAEEKEYTTYTYKIEVKKKTWSDAKTYCEENESVLASILDNTTNSDIQNQLEGLNEVWIGLSRPELWLWSFTKYSYKFINWQHGQPDNLNGKENCAAIVVKDGTWTDEHCKDKYPFFCFGIYTGLKSVVRMKFRSSTNLEDPALSADLKDQLRAEFANRGVYDFILSWKKPPVKETNRALTMKDAC